MISRDERREAEDRIARLIFAYCTRLDAVDFEGMASQPKPRATINLPTRKSPPAARRAI